jgi:hypothetical protein
MPTNVMPPREKIREWAERDRDLGIEIQELKAELLHKKHMKADAEFQLVEYLVQQDFYYLVKIDKTAVRKFMMVEEDFPFF